MYLQVQTSVLQRTLPQYLDSQKSRKHFMREIGRHSGSGIAPNSQRIATYKSNND